MPQKKKILVVDDTEINRALLADILSAEYDILEADNGLAAVDLLRRQVDSISLVLLDIVMPEMDGFEVLALMNRNNWLQSTPVVMISAEVSSSYVDHAYDLGATDYITRPFDEKTVLRRVQNTILLYTKQKLLEELVTEQIMEKERTNAQMVEILSNIVEFRNGESGMHVLHIRIITNMLLQALRRRMPEYGLTSAKIALIANASALHDIGKIAISETVLNKPGKLTPEEFEIMKTHTVEGAGMLERASQDSGSDLVHIARDICRWHHERYDGRGYPDGLKGDEIPLAAQVVALADVYDALVSPRVYKPAISHEDALQMILRGECGAFNPKLLDCFLEVADRVKKELEVRSPQGASKMELQNVASELMSHSELQVSRRTVTLLEQERIKYQFYASMSKEILFEYDRGTDLLTFSEWGAKYLGLPELIPNPGQKKTLREDGLAFLHRFEEQLALASPANPTVNCTSQLEVNGQPRWFKAVALTLWDNEDSTACSRVVGKLTDIHEEQVQLNELRELASRDALTGLYNRRQGCHEVEEILGREAGNYLLLVVDLDDFKTANDVYGHMFGDQVLKFVADKLTGSLRKGDVVARVGGDEFLVFLRCANQAEAVVTRLYRAMTREPCGSFSVSVSIGCARAPQDGENYEQLFKRADTALYAAKQQGKGTWRFYSEDMQGFPAADTPIDE